VAGREQARSKYVPSAKRTIGVLEDVVRDNWGRVLATLVSYLGGIELAEGGRS
jgi:hypothetical protein